LFIVDFCASQYHCHASPRNRALTIRGVGVALHAVIGINFHCATHVVIEVAYLLAAAIERFARRQRFFLGLARSHAVRRSWAFLWIAQAFARAFDDQRVIVATTRPLLNEASKITIIRTFANAINNAQS
jgi:hypothetical protein